MKLQKDLTNEYLSKSSKSYDLEHINFELEQIKKQLKPSLDEMQAKLFSNIEKLYTEQKVALVKDIIEFLHINK